MFLLRVRNDVPGLMTASSTRNGGALLEFGRAVALLLVPGFLAGFCTAAEVATKPPAAKQHVTKNVGVDEFDKLRTNNTSVILDVRTPSEFARGHIPGAVNIDWYAKNFTENVAALDKSHTYLVHCAVGGRSAQACERMEKLNFTNLYNLKDGFKAWEKAGKPTEKGTSDKQKPGSAQK